MLTDELLERLYLKQKSGNLQLKENQPVKFIITIIWDGEHEHCDCESTRTYTFNPDTVSSIIVKDTIKDIIEAIYNLETENILGKRITPDTKSSCWWSILTAEDTLFPPHCTCISEIKMYLQQDDIQIEVEPNAEA